MLPFRSGRAGISSALSAFLVLALLTCVVVAAEKKEAKPQVTVTPKKERKREEGVRDVPIAAGHDAKGLVLPDFDLSGRMRGKLEAGVTKRLDDENIQFERVKFTTFVPDTQTPQMEVVMKTSVLNLKTQVLTSQVRTTVKRSDFEIAGDTMKFEMTSRIGTLAGNVKMIVRGKPRTAGNAPE